MLRRALALGLAVISLGACSSPEHAAAPPAAEPAPASPEPAPTTPPAEPITGAPPPTTAPGAQPGERPAPRVRPYEPAPEDRLGALPPGLGIPAGQSAPDAVVKDTEGQEVRLAPLWQRGPVLLVFYRGGWCPFCNFQIQELIAAEPDLRQRGVTPVAISVDRVEESARTSDLARVPFAVLSDPDLAAHDAFHVVHQVGDAELARLLGYGIDVEQASGRTHHRFAVPSMFLIDGEGVVRWAHAEPDYKVRPTMAQVLAAVDHALGARSADPAPTGR